MPSAERVEVRDVRARLVDPRALCETLGLLGERSAWAHQHGGVMIRCPWHDDRSPSLSVRVGEDGTIGCLCMACGQGGDALSLVAVAYKLDLRSEFPLVVRAAAELAGLHVSDGPSSGIRLRPLPPASQRARTYPPESELAALLAWTRPCAEDTDVALWLRSRGLDPNLVDDLRLASALAGPARELPRFATYRSRSWVYSGHRLVIPCYDAYGTARSLRCGRVIEGDTPKRLPPAGYKAHGLVLADAVAVAMLAGQARPSTVCIVEGEPDFLTHATRRHRDTAVVGLVSGGWSAAIAARIPTSACVVVRTDHDQAGDKYAEEVSRSLRGRCAVRRSREA